jgi:hypothetical protein
MAACITGVVCLTSVAGAQAPAAPIASDTVMASKEVTATVTKINHKTREVTLKAPDGQEYSFVASDAVKNLGQVKKGDVVIAVYAEALAYEVKKGGSAVDPKATVAAVAAPLGQKQERSIQCLYRKSV